jgi:WD40 repeat protein
VTITTDQTTQDETAQTNNATTDNKMNDTTIIANINTNDESTREAREVQIAAMIASLESDPVYKKYIPTTNNDEEENATILATTTGMNNLFTTDKRKNGLAADNSSDEMSSNMNRIDPNNIYNLPISSYITLAPSSDSFTSSDGSGNSIQAKASVSTLCFEPSGARLVAGHRDGSLRFYDFHGMQPTSTNNNSDTDDTPYPPFRIVDSDTDRLDSTGRHVITSLGASYVGGGDGQWIVGTTSAQPHVLDREGKCTLFHFIKGDIYVTDADKNKGHIAPVTGVSYHPLLPHVAWSCGYDGSIRQWDLSGKGKLQFQKLVCQRVIGKCKNEKGQRTQIVSNISVHPNGRKVVVGTVCGSIQIWNTFSNSNNGVLMNSTRPLGAVYSAHGGDSSNNKPITFVTVSGDGSRIASRSELDDTVRIWDVNVMEKGTTLGGGKKFKKGGEHPPSLNIATCVGLPALNESATCAFGPDGRIICAGTSIDPRLAAGMSASSGKLKFYRLPDVDKRSKISSSGREEMNFKASSKSSNVTTTATLEPIMELNVAPGASVLGVQWHPKLNQIAIGTSNGIIRVLYDPMYSTKGALLPTSRSVRKSDGLSELLRSRAPTGSAAYLTSTATSSIITPNSLPMFRDAPKATRKTREDERNDPEKTKLPQPPVTGGMKTGGALGGGLNFAQHVKKSANYGNNKNIAGKDPREELFKYNEGKSYVSQAYEGNIQKILAEKTVEEEEAELKSSGSSNKRQKMK